MKTNKKLPPDKKKQWLIIKEMLLPAERAVYELNLLGTSKHEFLIDKTFQLIIAENIKSYQRDIFRSIWIFLRVAYLKKAISQMISRPALREGVVASLEYLISELENLSDDQKKVIDSKLLLEDKYLTKNYDKHIEKLISDILKEEENKHSLDCRGLKRKRTTLVKKRISSTD